MIAREVKIINASGLHTRPGARFVKEAKKYACDITLRRGQKECCAKSLLKVMKVGVCQGDMVTLVCDGKDETDAMEALTNLIAALAD
jgi:phosphotransferase system HPr (HPr) family protein